MIRVSVLYPDGPEATFDHEYYEENHRELVTRRLEPLGLVRLEVDRGIAGAEGSSAPYVTCGHLYFESVEDFESALEAHGDEILGDLPNFTNVEPVIQVSEITVEG